MERQAYADFDEFADALNGVQGRFVPTARATGDWWIENAHARGIGLQHIQVGGATTFAGDGAAGTVTLAMPASDPESIRIDGHALSDESYALLANDQPFTCSSRQLSRWLGVTVPLDQLSESGRRAAQAAIGGARNHTRSSLLEALRALALRICGDQQTINIVEPAAATAAQEEVLHCVGNVLDASNRANDRHIGRPQVSRTKVIARCLELIDAKAGQPLFIDDLCTATQVSERTLRNIFQEYFGVGPMRLLKVRQLREIRGALLAGDPVTDTVTRIAARFGVWDFSLFARNYRALYGEAPSQTLRRPRDRDGRRRDEELSATWIGYAARHFAFGELLSGNLGDRSSVTVEQAN